MVACGRRFGKTVLGVHRLVRPALEGYPVACFAPRFKFLLDIWREARRVLAPVVARQDAQERRIELATGGSVDFWSLEDPDAGRGRKYKRVVIDEAAKARHLDAAWNGSIRPTLTDYRGDADFLSTPRGMDAFWRGFVRGQDPAESEWASWRMPTVANPRIDPAEVEAARRQLPDRVFRQEYLAEFLEDAGGVFRGVAAAVDRGRTDPEPPQAGRTYSAGLDLARVEDYTVICVVDDRGRQVYHERFNLISWERQVARVVDVVRRYDATLTMDSTGVGDPIYEAIRKAGIRVDPYHFTNASKEALIDNLAMAIESGALRLMDVPEQAAELQAYEYELTPSRNVRMSAPEGMHDDCVVGLALAAWGRSNRKVLRFW